jgi:hypothetical protein
MKLEKKMMLDVEGGTWSECMAILRHEAGHTVQQAYQLHRRRRWQQLFGLSSKSYPPTIGRIQPAGVMFNIFDFGMRRAIRTKISPRPLRCGCGRVRTGGHGMPAGLRSKNLNLSTS